MIMLKRDTLPSLTEGHMTEGTQGFNYCLGLSFYRVQRYLVIKESGEGGSLF